MDSPPILGVGRTWEFFLGIRMPAPLNRGSKVIEDRDKDKNVIQLKI